VDERDSLAARFEEQRGQLWAVAYRMLGSPGEADDALREARLRLAGPELAETSAEAADSLPACLRTEVTRVCLDMLRSRAARRAEPTATAPEGTKPGRPAPDGRTLGEQVALADSVSRVLLVVLGTLEPAERVAFVLHDMFGVPFGEFAPVVERTPAATGRLAGRARRKVRGTPAVPATELAQQRDVVSAFLKAARNGDLPGVLDMVAPDVVRRADATALPPGVAALARGAQVVARGTLRFSARAQLAEIALVDGKAGAVVVLGGELWLALAFTVEDGKVAEYDVIADPARLRNLSLAILD
jgi:RNA polymerase sigma-70 factor (ECF subfamily)